MKLFMFIIQASHGDNCVWDYTEAENRDAVRKLALEKVHEKYPTLVAARILMLEVDPAKCQGFIEANFNIDKEPR
jgi:hypothetical protein